VPYQWRLTPWTRSHVAHGCLSLRDVGHRPRSEEKAPWTPLTRVCEVDPLSPQEGRPEDQVSTKIIKAFINIVVTRVDVLLLTVRVKRVSVLTAGVEVTLHVRARNYQALTDASGASASFAVWRFITSGKWNIQIVFGNFYSLENLVYIYFCWLYAFCSDIVNYGPSVP